MPRRAAVAFLGAGIALALLVFTWYAAFHLGAFEQADQSILSGFVGFHSDTTLKRLATFVAELCDPQPWIYLAAIPVLLALARRRPRIAFAAAAILLGANVTTQLLKPLLAEPRAHSLLGANLVEPASWPSGHATAAMSLALASVLAVPARLRPAVAAVGAGFAVAVSYSFLTLAWHYPSDVLGGYLLAGAWTLAVVGAVSAADARWPRRLAGGPADRLSVREVVWPPAAALLAAAALGGLLVLARPHQVVHYVGDHKTFVIGAAAIAAAALALATAIAFASSRR